MCPFYSDHAEVDENNPRRAAQCQRCGDVYNLDRLSPQFVWGGLQLINTHIYCCPRCLDEPAPFQRAIVLPPDPPPSLFALPIGFPSEEDDYFTLEDGTPLLDETLTISIVPES